VKAGGEMIAVIGEYLTVIPFYHYFLFGPDDII